MKSKHSEVKKYYNSLEKEKIDLYEQYINNSKILEVLNTEIEELKENKYKKDARDAKVQFGLWLGWLIGIISSIALRVAGLPDLSIIVNVGAIAFLVPSFVAKVLEFPHKKNYVEKKKRLREQIIELENENKKITETLIEIKTEQTNALLTAKANNHSPEFETLVNTIKQLKGKNKDLSKRAESSENEQEEEK